MNETQAAGGPLTRFRDTPEQAKQRRIDLTLRQNIDAQIKDAEQRVSDLKATKERLIASGILDTRIDDIQAAMRW